MKPKLHFAHGNGFPSPCYRQMLIPLEADFDCCYIDRIGHADDFPVKDNWHHLVDELIHSIERQSDVPVIGVGHSLGGVLTVLAALKKPALFQAVVLLDSPLLSRMRAHGVWLSKQLGLIERVTPAFRTKARRTHWKTREQALSYLKRRELFMQFDEACLNDYIDYGMRHDETGYALRFNVAVEYQIYITLPHSVSRYATQLEVPTTLIYGSESDVICAADRRHMLKRYGIQSVKTSGTHMFPFEHPKETARLILKVLKERQ